MATQTQTCIDREIAKQLMSLSNLRTQRNAFAPISRLPMETLATIFIHRAQDDHREREGCLTPTAPDWVNVSYVCRHWRSVALECPTLWTFLFMTSPRWTTELLARSRQAPLKLHLTPNHLDEKRPGWRFVEQVMDHVERVEELRIDLPSVCDHQFFSKLSTPFLKKLEISVVDGPFEWPLVPFDGDTSALHALMLSRCPLPWYSLTLSALTTLSLHAVPVRFQQNTAEFLDTLSCMKDLAHLYLDDALASAASFLPSATFITFQKISLPRLSHLLVVAPLSTVIALLSCVNIPLKTEVRLECRSEDESSLDDYSRLSSLLAQRFSTSKDQALSSPTIGSLYMECARWGKAILAFSASGRDWESPRDEQWGCNLLLRITIHIGRSMTILGDRNHVISDICCSVPLTKVQSVHVRHPPYSPPFWKDVLGHLQDLRHLKLSHGYMPRLASMLSLSPRDDAKNQGDRYPDWVFAPALEELELDNIILSTTPTDEVQALFDALSTRRESRVRFTMIECRVLAKYYTKLDMVYEWAGGHLCAVECTYSPRVRIKIPS